MRSDTGETATFTGRARRAQILRCAADAVAEGGFAAATLNDIARRAMVSKGVVSYYFAGKDDLLLQVVGDVYARAGAAIDERVKAASGPVGAIREYIAANLDFVAAHPADIQAVIEIASNLRDAHGALRLRPTGVDPLVRHLEGFLSAGQDSGVMGRFDQTSVAIAIRAMIDAAAGRLVSDPLFDIGTYTGEVIEMVARSTAPAVS